MRQISDVESQRSSCRVRSGFQSTEGDQENVAGGGGWAGGSCFIIVLIKSEHSVVHEKKG